MPGPVAVGDIKLPMGDVHDVQLAAEYEKLQHDLREDEKGRNIQVPVLIYR